MAARYSAGVVGKALGSSTNGAFFAVRAGAIEVRIVEIWLMATNAPFVTEEHLRIYATTAVGTATTSVLGQAEDPADAASVTNVDTAWSVEPTPAANPMKMRPLSANAGDNAVWHWQPQGGLVVAVSGSIIGRRDNAQATAWPTFAVTVVWEE